MVQYKYATCNLVYDVDASIINSDKNVKGWLNSGQRMVGLKRLFTNEYIYCVNQ